jgi:sirohydrochlorin ferrochelatase
MLMLLPLLPGMMSTNVLLPLLLPAMTGSTVLLPLLLRAATAASRDAMEERNIILCAVPGSLMCDNDLGLSAEEQAAMRGLLKTSNASDGCIAQAYCMRHTTQR